jgi:hypothetical protein
MKTFFVSSGNDSKNKPNNLDEFRKAPLRKDSTEKKTYTLLLFGSDEESRAELQRSLLKEQTSHSYGDYCFQIVACTQSKDSYTLLIPLLEKADVIALVPSEAEEEENQLEPYLKFCASKTPFFYLYTHSRTPTTAKPDFQLIDSSLLNTSSDVFLAIEGDLPPQDIPKDRFVVSAYGIQYIRPNGSSQNLTLSDKYRDALFSQHAAVKKELMSLKKDKIGSISLLNKKNGLEEDSYYVKTLLNTIKDSICHTNRTNVLKESHQRRLFLEQDIFSPRSEKKNGF